MSSYNVLATFYDELCKNVEYDVRSDYISDIFYENSIKGGTIIDLACGTGSMSIPLLKKGYRVIGIDLSDEMLEIASQRLLDISNNFSLRKGKMQNFSLEEEADACICCLDSINHLNSIDEVEMTFNCVYSSLKDNGIFIFDVNTIYKHQEILAGNTFIFDEDDYYLVWDNEPIDDRTVRIIMDIFCYNGASYDRYNEDFRETAYSVDELVELLQNAGFETINVYDELTYESPKKNSERLYFVCKKG